MQRVEREGSVKRLFPDLHVKNIEEPDSEVKKVKKKVKPPVCYFGGNIVRMHP
jgi:hypothetical protein